VPRRPLKRKGQDGLWNERAKTASETKGPRRPLKRRGQDGLWNERAKTASETKGPRRPLKRKGQDGLPWRRCDDDGLLGKIGINTDRFMHYTLQTRRLQERRFLTSVRRQRLSDGPWRDHSKNVQRIILAIN
jgi:hypothetical protein